MLPSQRIAIAIAALALTGATQAAPLHYPDTPRSPVSDTFHGVTVTDDYRWLENGRDPSVRKWSEAQTEVTRGALGGALHDKLRERFKELVGSAPYRYYGFGDTTGG